MCVCGVGGGWGGEWVCGFVRVCMCVCVSEATFEQLFQLLPLFTVLYHNIWSDIVVATQYTIHTLFTVVLSITPQVKQFRKTMHTIPPNVYRAYLVCDYS